MEFAAQLKDFLDEDIAKYFPHLKDYVKISIVELLDHILNMFNEKIYKYAEKKFLREGINLMTGYRVNAVEEKDLVVIQTKSGEVMHLPYGLCVWTTGITHVPLVKTLVEKIPGQTNKRAISTDGYLRVIGVNDVYAIGDCSTVVQEKLISKFVELFREYDTNQDGYLSLNEFEDFVSKSSAQYPQLKLYGSKVKELFEKGDENKDGKLTLSEFENLLKLVDTKLTFLPPTGLFLFLHIDSKK